MSYNAIDVLLTLTLKRGFHQALNLLADAFWSIALVSVGMLAVIQRDGNSDGSDLDDSWSGHGLIGGAFVVAGAVQAAIWGFWVVALIVEPGFKGSNRK
jgi:hypothetical protein